MPGRRKLFLSLFQAEIEDSREDADFLVLQNKKRFQNNEITNYVYNENDAFLSKESSGLKKIADFIGTFSAEDYENTDELAAALDHKLRKQVEEFDDPEAVYGIIKRKLQKVRLYVEDRQNG
ncbi:hypothetical protein LJC14_01360 [Treponema sp. OttesenSCG-928-L16]|nr:hypothetical protein [Treponema sp. OttesenSCG-928-L16]